jgi:F-type H+-transporting ATPase subunit a
MLGNNLTLSSIVHDPSICNAPFLGIPQLGTYGEIHVDTIGMALAGMGIILASSVVVCSNLTAERGGSAGQNLFEMYYGFIKDLCEGQMGSVYKTFLPLIGSIFIFILISNFLGVFIPSKMFEELHNWPKLASGEGFELASCTTDFNVTAALAAISLLTYVGSGFWAHGLHYLKVYLSPMVIIELMDLIIRPATLALRLMLVISADELLRGISLVMVPLFLPTGVMGFELFIGLIQAFVFTLLTAIYIGLTVSHH